MDKLRVLDLFSGIGGFSLGLERTGGFETAAFCEIEDFPRRVLAKHWPEVPCYHDVTKLTSDIMAADGIGRIDVITGGFPCQDISVAGKQAGICEGTRSGLWSEIVRLTGELRPRYVIVENVANLLSGPTERRGGWFGRILGDLAECGYDAEWENIPASAVGAPHRRERVWILAYPKEVRHTQRGEAGNVFEENGRQNGQMRSEFSCSGKQSQNMADANEIRLQGPEFQRRKVSVLPRVGNNGRWLPEPSVGRVANGVPNRAHRVAALGNAVVPQVPELIGHAILDSEYANKIQETTP